jgi:hypothetical protein
MSNGMPIENEAKVAAGNAKTSAAFVTDQRPDLQNEQPGELKSPIPGIVESFTYFVTAQSDFVTAQRRYLSGHDNGTMMRAQETFIEAQQEMLNVVFRLLRRPL